MIDLQSHRLQHPLTINQVGIKKIKHPIKIAISNDNIQNSIAIINMSVELIDKQRGTHMSRFVEILNQRYWVLSLPVLKELLNLTAQHLETETVYIQLESTIFLEKFAPVSKKANFVNYDVCFSGSKRINNYILQVTVSVPVTSLCPCSKAISDFSAHSQRACIQVTVESKHDINIQQLIRVVEKEASSEVYSILKRADEKYVTEQAYEKPKFVEDIVRDIAQKIEYMKYIGYYRIYSESYESIHNHSAFAVIERQI